MESHEQLEEDIVEVIRKGQKINAIKMLRERRNLGLKEAKELVDSYIDKHPELQAVGAEGSGKFLIGVIIFIAIATLLYMTGVIGK